MERRRRGKLRGDAPVFQRPARRPLCSGWSRNRKPAELSGRTLRRDLLAGVTVAALALPASLAYAEIAACRQ